MTPIFSRIWLVKMTQVLLLAITPVSLRSACDINRACKPTKVSPICPSISARGTKAATESMTGTSSALLRTRVSAIFKASSPQSGCDTRMSAVSTPMMRA